MVTPDTPFSVDDLTSDSIFYVQSDQSKAQAPRDVFSFYVSDGQSQTEAFNVEIDIQVAFCRLLPVPDVSTRQNQLEEPSFGGIFWSFQI